MLTVAVEELRPHRVRLASRKALGMPASGIRIERIAIPNFSFAAFTIARTIPRIPIAPVTAKTAISTSVAASIQPRKLTSSMPETAAAITTASIDRRPSFAQ